MYRLKTKIENLILYIDVGLKYGRNYDTLYFEQLFVLKIQCFCNGKPVNSEQFKRYIKNLKIEKEEKKELLDFAAIWKTNNLNYLKRGTKKQLKLISIGQYMEDDVIVDRGFIYNSDNLIKKISIIHVNKVIKLIKKIEPCFRLNQMI